MPHVIVKIFPGRSDDEKKRLADRVALAVMNTLGASDRSISVAVEDVPQENWTDQVYDPEIAGQPDKIYKKPGYDRF